MTTKRQIEALELMEERKGVTVDDLRVIWINRNSIKRNLGSMVRQDLIYFDPGDWKWKKK